MVFNTFGGNIDKYRGFPIPVLRVICSRYSEYRVNTGSSCQSTTLLELVHIKRTSWPSGSIIPITIEKRLYLCISWSVPANGLHNVRP